MMNVLIGLLALVATGCTDGGDDDAADDDAADDDAADDDAADDDAADDDDDAGDDDTVTAGDPSYGSNSAFDDVHDMADIINEGRLSYETHDRYWGIPFSDDHFHSDVTWPLVMTWDDNAAAIAQNEADAIAGGATPSGINVENGIIWISSPCTAPFMVHTDEATMSAINPFMRMAVLYHDFGGNGPVLDKIGIGASDVGNGDTAWVLVFN